MRGLALFAACLLVPAAPAGAVRYAGSEPFEFLFLDGGALQAGVGGAFTAGRGHADGLAYNPASLADMDFNHVSFMRTSHFQGVRRDHVAAALRSGFGFSFDSVGYGDIERTTLSSPSGGMGTFSAKSQSAAFAFATPLGERLAVGAAARHIRETIDDATARVWAADIGAQWRLFASPPIVLGAAVRNLGPKARFSVREEELPRTLRWGAAAALSVLERPVHLLADAVQDRRGHLTHHLGISVMAAPMLSLRLGYNGRNDAGIGITAGFGLHWQGLSFDYAMAPYGALGSSHQLSLGLRWGPKPWDPVFGQR